MAVFSSIALHMGDATDMVASQVLDSEWIAEVLNVGYADGSGLSEKREDGRSKANQRSDKTGQSNCKDCVTLGEAPDST